MNEICLENFSSNIHPFLVGDSLYEFFLELKKVPNYQSVFRVLLEKDPAWLKQAQTSTNGISFLCQKVSVQSHVSLQNKLELRHFEGGEYPTIKVTKYVCTDL